MADLLESVFWIGGDMGLRASIALKDGGWYPRRAFRAVHTTSG